MAHTNVVCDDVFPVGAIHSHSTDVSFLTPVRVEQVTFGWEHLQGAWLADLPSKHLAEPAVQLRHFNRIQNIVAPV